MTPSSSQGESLFSKVLGGTEADSMKLHRCLHSASRDAPRCPFVHSAVLAPWLSLPGPWLWPHPLPNLSKEWIHEDSASSFDLTPPEKYSYTPLAMDPVLSGYFSSYPYTFQAKPTPCPSSPTWTTAPLPTPTVAGQNLGFLRPLKLNKKYGDRVWKAQVAWILSRLRWDHSRLTSQELCPPPPPWGV